MFTYPHLYLKLYLEKIEDYFRYDVFNQTKEPYTLPPAMNITFEYDKEDKSYFAKATHLEGVYTSANDIDTLIKNINYQLYEYFYVPRYRFKELGYYYKPPINALERAKEKGAPITVKIAAGKHAPAS
jgi:hypothetical protein